MHFKFSYLILIIYCVFNKLDAQTYLSMMKDYQVNIYDVKKEADAHFQKVGTAKGSGYKPFQRWWAENEPKFFPSGDRSRYNPYQAVEAFKQLSRTSSDRSLSNPWTELGPDNANNVTTHYAPGIGRVECVYVVPNNNNKIYMSSRSGGLWKTIDGGVTWACMTTSMVVPGVNTFAVNPLNSDDVLINIQSGTNETTHGIFRSVDGGNTWATTPFNPAVLSLGGLGTNDYVFDIKFHPLNNDTIYIATSKGIYRSINNFLSVTRVRTSGCNSIAFHGINANIIYVTNVYSNTDILVKSIDGGTTWANAGTLSNNNNAYLSLQTSKANPNTLYLYSSSGVWKTTDTGLSFIQITAAANDNYLFGISDTDTTNMLYGGINTYRSTNGGSTWSKATEWYKPDATATNYVHADLRYVYSLDGVFYIGTDGYLCKSLDKGVSWTTMNDGTSIRENYRLGVSQSNHDWVSLGSQDNGSSLYKDGTWVEWYGADGMEQIVHPLNPNLMIANIQNGEKHRTFDGALSTEYANAHEVDKMAWVAPCAYNPMSHNTLYSVGNKVYKSTNFGTTYTSLHDFGADANQLAVAENNANLILVSVNSALHKSTNGGVSFSQIGSGILPNNFIHDIAFDPQDDNTFIVVYNSPFNLSNRVMITRDGGSTFQSITYNLNNLPVRSVVIDQSPQKNIYLGTEIGVYAKAMSATTWSSFNNGLQPISINELEIQYGSNTLYAASWGRGLWKAKLINRQDYPVITDVISSNNIVEGINSSIDNSFLVKIEDLTKVSNAFVTYSINNNSLETNLPIKKINEDEYAFDLNGLGNIGDSIYFKVHLVGMNNDTTSSYRYNYKLINTPSFCSSQGASNTGGDYIDKVTVGSNFVSSVKNAYTYTQNSGFNVNQYNSQVIKIKIAAFFNGDAAAAWVDWDRSGSFDTNELTPMTPYVNRESVGTIIPPPFVKPGIYRLRTRNLYQSALSPCGSVAGEVEDYDLTINPSCNSNPIVNTINDRYVGSLRFWMENTCANDTIYFDNSIVDDTIKLFSEKIISAKNISIAGSNAKQQVISGEAAMQLFQFNHNVNLINLELIKGSNSVNGGAFYNTSNLTLRNVTLKNNSENGIEKSFTTTRNVTIMPGLTKILK